MKIIVTGLGAGTLEQMSFGVFRLLKNAKALFLRTKEHPVVAELEKEGIMYHSFDQLYENNDHFSQIYEEIVAELMSAAKKHNEIVYAVPGHPLVAERTVQLLLEKSKNGECDIEIKGGQSFLDDCFTSLQIDPIEGFQLVDGTSLRSDRLEITQHIIICQVYDSFIASNVKLTLMEVLPDDYEIVVLMGAGASDEKKIKIKLYELDRHIEVNNLAVVYVPPVERESLLYGRFSTLRHVIATLRGPNGCPWDKKQTHESLKKYLVEETYEVLEAIDEQDEDHLVEELGDVLLQVMLHSQIGEDNGYFSIDDVIASITKKMIYRHPHVFGTETVADAEEVVKKWEQLKQQEKKGKQTESLLSGIPKDLPSLYRAAELQKRAANVGFDWDDAEPMWDKVFEEIEEFRAETSKQDKGKMQQEFGDILFAFINIARYYKIDPEEAIRATNRKFEQRFQYMEQRVADSGLAMSDLSLQELDEFWKEAKRLDKKGGIS